MHQLVRRWWYGVVAQTEVRAYCRAIVRLQTLAGVVVEAQAMGQELLAVQAAQES
jgi:hypothetical protein